LGIWYNNIYNCKLPTVDLSKDWITDKWYRITNEDIINFIHKYKIGKEFNIIFEFKDDVLFEKIIYNRKNNTIKI